MPEPQTSDAGIVVQGARKFTGNRARNRIAMTMAVYLSISLSISLFMNWYNRKKQLVER